MAYFLRIDFQVAEKGECPSFERSTLAYMAHSQTRPVLRLQKLCCEIQ